jgi:hypothetical protein
MNKFSIAPWKTAHSYSHEYIRSIKDAQGELIAQVCAFDDGVGNDYIPETTANARLIAAAPDLLAALRDLLSRAEIELDQTEWHEGLVNCDILAKSRAAISKALGEQTA